MAASPEALVCGGIEGNILELGETAPFSGSGVVELTGSPVVIPDDGSARVDWQYQDVRDSIDC